MSRNRKVQKGLSNIITVIIVAIFAILLATAIPFIVMNRGTKGYTPPSEEEISSSEEEIIITDEMYVDEANRILALKEEEEGKNRFCRDALKDLRNEGIDILEFESQVGNEIIYDETVDRFFLLKEDEFIPFYPKNIGGTNDTAHHWKFVDRLDGGIQYSYCYYAKNGFFNQIVQITDSFDCGNNENISTISLADDYIVREREIYLFTKNSSITVNGPYKRIDHYNNAWSISIEVPNATYIEHGHVSNIYNIHSETNFSLEETSSITMAKESVDYIFEAPKHIRSEKVIYGEEEPIVQDIDTFISPIDPARRGAEQTYNEEVDNLYDDLLDDLINGFPTSSKSYKSTSRSYLSLAALKNYFYRNNYQNLCQENIALYTENSYYIYPKWRRYYNLVNLGYVNHNYTVFSFALEGREIEEKLIGEVKEKDLVRYKDNSTYQKVFSTLDEFDEDFFNDNEFMRVKTNKFETTSLEAITRFLPIVAPNFVDNENYFTFTKLTIELLDDSVRIRIYVDTNNMYDLVYQNTDEYNAPNWYCLFAETVLSDFDNVTFLPTANL